MSKELNERTTVVIECGYEERYDLNISLCSDQVILAIDGLLLLAKERLESFFLEDCVLLKTGCRYGRQYDVIKLSDIAYISMSYENRHHFLHLQNDTSYEIDWSQDEIERYLPKSDFIYLRNKEVINMNYIKGVSNGGIIALDGTYFNCTQKNKLFVTNLLNIVRTYKQNKSHE